jgi:hypothetical protein
MAKLEPGFGFIGTLGNVSAFKRRDMEKVIIRTKGGASKQKIKSHPHFDITRRNNQEFGGRASFSGWILRSLHHLKPLSDYNMAGPLNSLLKPIQLMDTVSEFGKRNIVLSKNPGLLEGFPLNKRNNFENVVRAPISCTVEKAQLRARIETPVLQTLINFFPVETYPLFRWQACLAPLPDHCFSEGKKYQPLGNFNLYSGGQYQGEWLPSRSGADAGVIELSVPVTAQGNDFSLMLAVGISFATIKSSGPEQVKYAGAGKILKVV